MESYIQKLWKNCGLADKVAWAFGLGLDRLAMKLFDIPDIRVFWSTDEKILTQWERIGSDCHFKFKKCCSIAPITEDLSFCVPTDLASTVEAKENGEDGVPTDFADLVREETEDYIASISRFDKFTHPKTGRVAHGYRLTFCPSDAKMNNSADFKKITVGYLAKLAKMANEKLGYVQK